MIEVINGIISIEKKAQEIIQSAHKEKDLKINEMNKKIVALEHRIKSDAERKVKQLRERELNEVKDKANQLIMETNERIAIMEEFARERKAMWVDQLVEAVLKR